MADYPYGEFTMVSATNPDNLAAQNDLVTIHAPGDATRTPIELRDLGTGQIIGNPIASNVLARCPGFITTIPEVVAYAAGPGIEVLLESTAGIRDDARAAALEAANAGIVAAQQAKEEFDTRVAAGDFQGPQGLPGVNAVPAATAVAAYLTGDPGTKAALHAEVGHGLVRVEGDDLTGAVNKIVTAGAGTLYIQAGQTVTTSTTTALPDAVKGVRVDGEILCTANVPVFTRDGVVSGATTNITAGILAGQRTVSAVATDLTVGDWVFVVSADTLPTTSDKLGYLRKVRALTETTVAFDSPIPRDMPSSTRRLRKITLAQPIEIYGSGTIRYNNPAAYTASMLAFTFCQGVTVRGVTLQDGGGRSIALAHVAGFNIDCRIDNFIDDLAGGHIGYGVDAQGATRDGRITGRITRCRHAFTTNVGPNHPAFSFYGEPENIDVAPITAQCSDKALDTHRAGWGIRLHINDKGSGGGAQVRADATYVEGVVEGNYVGAGVWVHPGLINPPTIGPVKILNHAGDGVVLDGPAKLTAFPDLHNVTGTGIKTAAGVTGAISPETATYIVGTQATVNNTTTATATGISFPAVAGATYRVRGFLIYYSTTTADINFSWSVPAGATLDWAAVGMNTQATTHFGDISRRHLGAAEASPHAGVGSGIRAIAEPSGLLRMGATGGTVSLLFAQFVAEASNTAVYPGSHLIVDRIA